MPKHAVKKYCVVVPNQPGMLDKVTHLLANEGVNIDSLTTESLGDYASFRFLLEKENGVRRKFEAAGFQLVEDKAFRLDLPNRPGELNRLANRLAAENISIRYLYGTSHGETTKVVLGVDQPDAAASLVEQYQADRHPLTH